MTEQHIRPK